MQSYQKAIAAEEKLFRQKEAVLQLPEGGIETVQANFRQQEKRLKDINREFLTHKENYSNLVAAHEDHSDRHFTLRDYVQDTAELMYFKNLEGKNYVGKMEFDHEKKTLVVSVDVNSRTSERAPKAFGGHKVLSGGENSYSNVCLLLALSAISTCPWQVLDEFDVFMDQNHRKLALELICDSMKFEEGARICKSQLIFITPHSIPTEISERPEVSVSVVVRPSAAQ